MPQKPLTTSTGVHSGRGGIGRVGVESDPSARASAIMPSSKFVNIRRVVHWLSGARTYSRRGFPEVDDAEHGPARRQDAEVQRLRPGASAQQVAKGANDGSLLCRFGLGREVVRSLRIIERGG